MKPLQSKSFGEGNIARPFTQGKCQRREQGLVGDVKMGLGKRQLKIV